MQNVEKTVKETICKMFYLEPGELKDSTRMIEDLGIDSLDFGDLCIELEKIYGISIPPSDEKCITVVSNLVKYIQDKVNEKCA